MELMPMGPWTLDAAHARAGGMMMPKRKATFPAAIRHQTLLILIEQAREKRGSPPLWDVVAARLHEANRQQDAVAPRLDPLDKIRERVDDET